MLPHKPPHLIGLSEPEPTPVTDAQIDQLAHTQWRWSSTWWEQEAWQAISEKRFEIIRARPPERHLVYLVRMWLNKSPSMNRRGHLESGNSVLLHYFARGDNDQSLHDHPWDFTTTILAGAYTEHLPPEDWAANSHLGPAWDEVCHLHSAGSTIHHRAEDLHCVGWVQEGTFTLMRTDHRRRTPWGFHPPGKPWVDWETYLGLAPTETPASSIALGEP